MSVKPISKKLAEKALAAVKEQFKVYVEGLGSEPTLVESWSDGGHWAICWEDGPDEWALRCPEGGFDEELSYLMGKRADTPAAESWPKEVFGEPYYTFVLVLYPA